MKRFYFVTVLLVSALLVISGCGNRTAQTTESQKVKEYSIGTILPLTGNAGQYGEDMRRGVDYAVEKINSRSNETGIKVSAIHEDSQALPEKAVNAMQKLVQVNKVPAVLIGFSSPTLAVTPIADKNKTLLVNAAAVSPNLAGAGQYLFNTIALQDYEIKVLMDYAFKDLNIHTIAVIGQNNDLGLGLSQAIKKEFQDRLKGQLVDSEMYAVGDTDFRTQLAKIKQFNPDAIYLATAGQDTALVMKQAREMNIQSQFLGYHSIEMPPNLMQLAGQAVNGAIYSSGEGELDQNFIKDFKAKYGKEPVFTDAAYYDATQFIFQAISKLVSSGKEVTGENLRTAFLEIREFKGVAGPIRFNDNGTVSTTVTLKKVSDGQKGVFNLIKTVNP
ncbi:ABC transporter substrate-binding protein [Paradesulfitobacterium aromaticivorans]